MAKPEVLAFVQRVVADEELRKRVEAISSEGNPRALADMARIAAETGYAFSVAELEVSLKELGAGELGDAALDGVSGGTGNLTELAIQMKMQNISQIAQMMSNIARTDSDAKLNAIRNVRS
jgi:predicted ribosomally synthesized peptide with nif11-like leader